MSSVNTIWISSTPRTGSMWTFNVAREIHRILGFKVEPSIVPQSDKSMFEIYENNAKKEENKDVRFILKVHSILKPDLVRSKIITIIRDPRDICISFKEFMKADFVSSLRVAKSLVNFSKTYKKFNNDYLFMIKYEDIEKRPIELILDISKFLKLNLNRNQAEEISEKFLKKKVIEIINKKNDEIKSRIIKKEKIDKKEVVVISNNNIRAFDTNTGFQTGHVSKRQSGDWEKSFTNEEKEILNKEFKNWLIDFKYI